MRLWATYNNNEWMNERNLPLNFSKGTLFFLAIIQIDPFQLTTTKTWFLDDVITISQKLRERLGNIRQKREREKKN